MTEFKCDKCGLCCQNLHNNPLYSDLDDGTGVCIHYDRDTHLCKIYENRPTKCNVEKAYTALGFEISYEEYLALNYDACRKLTAAFACQSHS